MELHPPLVVRPLQEPEAEAEEQVAPEGLLLERVAQAERVGAVKVQTEPSLLMRAQSILEVEVEVEAAIPITTGLQAAPVL